MFLEQSYETQRVTSITICLSPWHINIHKSRGVEPEPEPLRATHFVRSRSQSQSYSDFVAPVAPTLEASIFWQTLEPALNDSWTSTCITFRSPRGLPDHGPASQARKKDQHMPPTPIPKRQRGQTHRWNPLSIIKNPWSFHSYMQLHGMCPHCPRVDPSTPKIGPLLAWDGYYQAENVPSMPSQVCKEPTRPEVDHLWQIAGPSGM